jgi:hypothetical protein|tara:strand:- start:650 stop:1075 length:426 start_codon:yes stop_codon:yes gene_type:complete
MRFKKIDNMKKLVFIVLLYLPFLSFSQEYIDDSNFDDKISEQSAFGDDESTIVVVEFWAKFNEANAFADWNKIEGVNYYRVDLAKAPSAKKEYRVRMAPTIIIFKDGIKEESFKAGLDLECPVTLDELIEAIEEVKTANQF